MGFLKIWLKTNWFENKIMRFWKLWSLKGATVTEAKSQSYTFDNSQTLGNHWKIKKKNSNVALNSSTFESQFRRCGLLSCWSRKVQDEQRTLFLEWVLKIKIKKKNLDFWIYSGSALLSNWIDLEDLKKKPEQRTETGVFHWKNNFKEFEGLVTHQKQCFKIWTTTQQQRQHLQQRNK